MLTPPASAAAGSEGAGSGAKGVAPDGGASADSVVTLNATESAPPCLLMELLPATKKKKLKRQRPSICAI